jgi:OPA family sugar phosphate sensor protein UhpC-like MFS transporter
MLSSTINLIYGYVLVKGESVVSWKALDYLKPAPYQPVVKNQQEIDSDYRYWRIRICYSIFIGYVVFYFTRKSFTSIMPFLMEDLHFTKADLGILSSILSVSYAISKLVSGVMSDRANPRYFMATGLILTGVMNILFGMSSDIVTFAIFWGLNGWSQAWGWPACCKQLNYWFAQSERGLWYSVCSTSHNIGGGLIPLIAVFIALHFGWRYAMFVPAFISIAMGFILMNRLRDVPRTLGLPTVEEYRSKTISKESQTDTAHSSLPVLEILFKQVLNNKFVWIFSLSYFFVYVVRAAINDWTPLYLHETKNMELLLATSGVSWFEAGGVIGMIAAGWGSDYFWKGNRVPVVLFCAIGLILSLVGLKYVPAGHAILDMSLLGLIGFFVFGPQMIVGLAAAEFVDKRAAATSNGFAGTWGYFGAAVAGWPAGKLIDAYGWNAFLTVLIISSAVVLLMLFPLWTKGGDRQLDNNRMGWNAKRAAEET